MAFQKSAVWISFFSNETKSTAALRATFGLLYLLQSVISKLFLWDLCQSYYYQNWLSLAWLSISIAYQCRLALRELHIIGTLMVTYSKMPRNFHKGVMFHSNLLFGMWKIKTNWNILYSFRKISSLSWDFWA